MKANIKLILLYVGSLIVSIAPLCSVFVVKWSSYTKTPTATVKLCAGAVIVLFFIFLKVIGKLRLPRRIVTFSVVFVLIYLLQPIMYDLLLLSGMALIGEFLDVIFFQHAIKVIRENKTIDKTANATAKQVEEILAKMGKV